MSDGGPNTPGATESTSQGSKPKRVRTGCLTCRERHLKCDEATPICQNCKKSNRTCKRGVRLNFIDTQVQAPPVIPPMTQWHMEFIDESVEIAREYVGGVERYAMLEIDPAPKNRANHSSNNSMTFDFSASMPPPTTTAHHTQSLPPIQGFIPDTYTEEQTSLGYEQPKESRHHHTHSHSESSYSGSNVPTATALSSYGNSEQPTTPPSGGRDFLGTQEEVLFMQVFVEEVGCWMDSMDPLKHFSRLLPFHALSEPMLLNAFLACGARHLALVNPKYSEEKALHYYDTATRYLLASLQDPNRDTVICATTAVILNVYEIMCEKALQRMNHIAGARALIKECGWNARSAGIGAACFWLNVGMEILSCLHFNWQVAWDPDEWGVDMSFERETESGREEVWTHRIVYIVAKVANFRASIPRTQSQQDQMRLQQRYHEWERLKTWAEAWNQNIPRTMHPVAYLYPGQTISGSAFPEVWLIKRATIVARLFYHTCMCLLAQINPIKSPEEDDMREMQQQHSQLICGIVAHVKDRGVASVALRSLAIAAECLTNRREQEEVLQIFDKIRQETGWRVGFLNTELRQKWGWNDEAQQQQQQAQPEVNVNGNVAYQQYSMQPQVQMQQVTTATAPPVTNAPPRTGPPRGIPNPILATADFNLPQHPYQSYYVAPNSITHQAAQFPY